MSPEPLPAPGSRDRLLWLLQTFVLLLVVWIALDGAGSLAVGAGFALLGAAAGAWLAPGVAYPWRPLRLAAFTLYFLLQSLRGGLDVAWRALHPALPIEPCFCQHALRLGPGLPRTAFVSIVSLLPGTLSVIVDAASDRLTVHTLTPAAASELPALEQRVAHLFSVALPEC